MIVLVLNNAPLSLRGVFSLYLIEIRANVFYGKATQKVKKFILDELERNSLNYPDLFDAICIDIQKNSHNIYTYGKNRREKILFDGLELFSFKDDNLLSFFDI